jgi:ParB family chromosome partitioning protein
MEEKKQPRGLGRGLAALLPDAPSFLHEGGVVSERVLSLDTGLIKPNPQQPRRYFDEERLAELAASIREHGLLQPLIVSEAENGGYMIIAGERRWRAAQSIGLPQVACLIRSLEEQHLRELSLIENIQREDLQPLEEAQAYRDLLDQYNYTQEQLAARLGKSRSHLANTLRLLSLAPQFQELLRRGLLSAGHARAILSLPDEERQALLAQRIIKENLSVRQAEQLAQKLREAGQQTPPPPAPPPHPVYADIARRLKDKWGVKVAVHDNKGRGKIIIDYYSEDDLQRVLDSLLEEEM